MGDILQWNNQQSHAAKATLERATSAACFPSELQGVDSRTLQLAGVIGGGTMGAGIAVALLAAGLKVNLVERDEESASRGRANVFKILDRALEKGRITDNQHQMRIRAFSASASYETLTDSELVVEAVFEDLSIKRDVFKTVTAICDRSTMLATNTSYLDPRAIFNGLPYQERSLGLHFFSPAHVMKLLEIIPTNETSDQVLAAAFDLARRCGKIPVRSGICDGFIGNRLLKLMRAQAERLLLAGASPGSVDASMRAFGMAMGPFEGQDLSGLDIAAYQRKAARARGEESFAPVGDLLVEAGRLGRKSGAGWYDYQDDRRLDNTPQFVEDAITSAQRTSDLPRREWKTEELIEAILLPMVGESSNIIYEKIALRTSDIDLVETYGYGFPKDRGGLLIWAQGFGFAQIYERLNVLRERKLAVGSWPLLKQWARESELSR
jgi:3-hydroxyacyl-CoA dehydrogenase